MSEIMDKADVLERYARYQAAETEPTLVRDAFRYLIAQLDARAATVAALEAEVARLRGHLVEAKAAIALVRMFGESPLPEQQDDALASLQVRIAASLNAKDAA